MKENNEVTIAGVSSLPVSNVKAQVNSIQAIMGQVMIDGQHYGVIPNTNNKKVLLKAGAEKLGFVFRLSPHFEVVQRDEQGSDHREYEIKTILTHIDSGKVVAEGLGVCSTKESKFRYRNDYIDTGKPVPKDYWDGRDPAKLGGSGFVPKKVDGQWFIFKSEGKKDHADPADYYNTVLKMAKKRSHVDAVITATAASDIFDQDLDEKYGLDQDDSKPSQAAQASQNTSTPKAKEQPPQMSQEVQDLRFEYISLIDDLSSMNKKEAEALKFESWGTPASAYKPEVLKQGIKNLKNKIEEYMNADLTTGEVIEEAKLATA